MKEFKDTTKEKKDFFKSKGIYIVIAICVVIAGTLSWIGVNNQLESLKKNNSDAEQNVENKKEDVKKNEAEQNPPSISQGQSSQGSTTTANTQKPPTESTQQQQLSNQSYIMPIEGNILKGFSNGELVKSVTLNDWRTHNGIDIASKLNDKVKAISQGVVKDVYESPLWGTVVELQLTDGTICVYANLNKNPNVKKGQQVKSGDLIGTVGKTASAEIGEEDHLHFEMIKDGKYIDPLSVIKK